MKDRSPRQMGLCVIPEHLNMTNWAIGAQGIFLSQGTTLSKLNLKKMNLERLGGADG